MTLPAGSCRYCRGEYGEHDANDCPLIVHVHAGAARGSADKMRQSVNHWYCGACGNGNELTFGKCGLCGNSRANRAKLRAYSHQRIGLSGKRSRHG